MGINLVNLVGRAGAEPDITYYDSGSVLCRLSLAVNRPTSRSDRPDWFNLKIWGKTAEVAKNYVRKGSLIGVQGTLSIENWTDRKTGVNRSTPVIKVDRLELLGSKRDIDPSTVNNYADSSGY
ncbi:MAG: single-stranded DNA-binding protein [Cyanobacteria bacterium J083]|nr:MAG: single-stranded DNA-binding protein [Cyanobacteria bacterium J083]